MKHLKPLLQFIALLALIIVYSRWIVSLPEMYYDTIWPDWLNRLYFLLILPISSCVFVLLGWLVWLLLNVTGGHNSFACILLLLAGWALVIAGVFARRDDKGANHEPKTANPA